MWTPYLRPAPPPPTEADRKRLEAAIGGPLPPGYWALASAHGGEAIDEDLVGDEEFASLILLSAAAPEALGKAQASYTVAAALAHTMPRYPAGLLPFADDSGGNLWAFDYRADPAAPSIVFIDHEEAGEDGITVVAPDFATLLTRLGLPPATATGKN